MRAVLVVLVLVLAAAAGWFWMPRATRPLGTTLVVDGTRVSEEEIQRWLIYGPCRARLEARKTRWLVQSEIELLAARECDRKTEASKSGDAPRSPGDDRALAAACAAERARIEERCAVGDEELELEYARTVEEFQARNPSLGLEAEIGRTYRRSDWFRAELRIGLEFDKLFFPAEPDDWPQETWEALEHEELRVRDPRSLSRRSLRDLFGGRDWRELRHENPEELARMRESVRRHLARRAEFRTSTDGLSAGLVLTAHGAEGCTDLVVRTQELWREVADAVEDWEVDDARRWIAVLEATRARLAHDGAQPSQSDREHVVMELEDRAEETRSTPEAWAVGVARFPSPEAWVEHHLLREGFRAVVPGALAFSDASAALSPELAARVERSSRLHGGARVHVEILLVAAADIARNRWPSGGWDAARAKATALRARLDANERAWSSRTAGARNDGAVEPFVYWNRLLDEESDWWDPPDPRAGELARPPRNHGRFYGRTWDELRLLVGESASTDWIGEASISEAAFFTQKPGTIVGPVRCALGYALVRLAARTPPERKLDPRDARDRATLVDDDLRERFARYAHEAFAHAKVEGLAN